MGNRRLTFDRLRCPGEQYFQRILKQYDLLRKRGAYIEQYKKEDMFRNGLEEFDDSRNVVQELIEEYKACETPVSPPSPPLSFPCSPLGIEN